MEVKVNEVPAGDRPGLNFTGYGVDATDNPQEGRVDLFLDTTYPVIDPNFAYPKDTATLTTFQSGHGFTAVAPSTGTQADDTADYLIGSQALKLTTLGTGGSQVSRKTAIVLDLTGRYLALAVKVDHPERLTSLRVDISADNTFTNWSTSDHISPTTNLTSPFFVPDEWINLLIPWGSFAVGGGTGAVRSAITAIQVRCTDDGSGPIIMRVNKLSAVAEPANAVVSLTFDDGYASAFTKAKPILDAGGFRAGFAPIINKIGASNFMTLAQLKLLRDSGWEPMVHAYDIALHNAYDTTPDYAAVQDSLKAKSWMRRNGFGNCDNFIIPQGQITTADRSQAWRQHFNVCRTAYTRNRETYPPARRWGTRSYTLSPAHLPADITAKIDEAIANKEWLVLEIHDIVTSGGDGVTTYLTADLQTVISYLTSTGVKVKTVSEVIQSGVA